MPLFLRPDPSHTRSLRSYLLLVLGLGAVQLVAWLVPPATTAIAAYLPLHLLMETISIVVAALVFSVGWTVKRHAVSSNTVVLACLFFAVAWLDFFHTASYVGMPEFLTPNDSEKHLAFWLSARFLAAVALLLVAIRPWELAASQNFHAGALSGAAALTLGILWVVLFHQDVLPRTFVVGEGLTPFKKNAEYLIIVINLVTAALLWRKMRRPQSFNAAALFAAALVLAQGEFFFTLYTTMTGAYNVLGHVYKVAAYLIIYRAIVVETIDRPYAALHASQAQLQRSERFTRSIAQNVPSLLGYWTPQLRCTFANQAYLTWFGRTEEEMLGIGMQELMGEAMFQQNEPYARAALAGVDQAFERAILRPDGQTRVTWTQYIAQREGDTVVGILVLATDITPIKQAQDALQTSLNEKVGLLNEVHHRVKNNLQVITSLLRLERGRSQHASTRTVLQAMQNRIRSMSLLHESIYRSGTFAAVDLGNYLRQIAVQSFRTLQVEAAGVQLRLELGTVQVGLDQATPCGLLLSELLSNCLKHAFPAGRTGEVCISLQPLLNSAQWSLRVSDTGVGLPADFDQRQHGSLGLQLVSSLATQLGGRLEIGPGPVFVVHFIPQATMPHLTVLQGT